jgi:hypothetical protein
MLSNGYSDNMMCSDNTMLSDDIMLCDNITSSDNMLYFFKSSHTP